MEGKRECPTSETPRRISTTFWAQLFLGLFWWIRHQICREIWNYKDVMHTIDSDRGGYTVCGKNLVD